MPTYYVSEAGSNGDGLSWANAKTTLAAAIALANADGDIIKIDKDHTGDNNLAADTAFTFTNAVRLICCDKDSSDALSQMTSFIGKTSSNVFVQFRNSAGKPVYMYGIVVQVGGTGSDSISIGEATYNTNFELENCVFNYSGTSTSAYIQLGSTGNALEAYVRATNCDFRLGNASQSIKIGGKVELVGCTFNAGTAPTNLFTNVANDIAGAAVFGYGCDFSICTSNLVSGGGTFAPYYQFANCKMGAGVALVNVAAGAAGKNNAEVLALNCSSGDTHYHIWHQDACGETTVSASIYASDNICDTNLSWKIVTSSNASFYTPYYSPWISKYNSDVSTSIQPYLEGLRSSASASAADTVFNDDEVWGEFSIQDTANVPLAVITRDRMPPLGSPAAQTSSKSATADWVGEETYKSAFKLQAPAAATPNEVGHLMARVCVGIASTTLYVDPQIRV